LVRLEGARSGHGLDFSLLIFMPCFRGKDRRACWRSCVEGQVMVLISPRYELNRFIFAFYKFRPTQFIRTVQ
jgi:hypothetical protein